MRAGPERKPGIQSQIDCLRYRGFTPGWNYPKTIGNAQRPEFALRSTYPVVLCNRLCSHGGDLFQAGVGTRRADSAVIVDALVEKSANPIHPPHPAGSFAGLVENRAFLGAACLRVRYIYGTGTMLEQGIRQRFGPARFYVDRNTHPRHRHPGLISRDESAWIAFPPDSGCWCRPARTTNPA